MTKTLVIRAIQKIKHNGRFALRDPNNKFAHNVALRRDDMLAIINLLEWKPLETFPQDAESGLKYLLYSIKHGPVISRWHTLEFLDAQTGTVSIISGWYIEDSEKWAKDRTQCFYNDITHWTHTLPEP